MVVLRLSRGGAKKCPFYRIVAADKRMPLGGRFLDIVGTANPMARGQEPALTFKMDRVDYWLKNGAQPSKRVRSLIKQYKKEALADNTAEEQAAE